MSMDPPPAPTAVEELPQSAPKRSDSFSNTSQKSGDSQTAAEFLRDQEILEADAREALPYSIENCTKILGPLRQNVFACLTCNPPPAKAGDEWTPAGVCYACSVQCHGEHTLVEIFQKRNFTCDCGTTRIPSTSPCSLRLNEETKSRGGVHSEEPDVNNKYNQNFRNRFCGCECDYDPFQQKGTMFQCLGLGTSEAGGCGEDWYHPGCLVGMGPKWFEKMEKAKPEAPNETTSGNGLATISEGNENQRDGEQNGNHETVIEDEEEDVPMPPGFPEEDHFEGFLCHKCVEANPWIKRYAGTSGFLPAVYLNQPEPAVEAKVEEDDSTSRKRKAEDDVEETAETKRLKAESDSNDAKDTNPTPTEQAPVTDVSSTCKLPNLPPAPTAPFSLFFKEDFRTKFCRCSTCSTHFNDHPQLLEEEEVYEPPLSDGASQHGGSTHGSGSLLERGESALRNVDRVRAIEGVMAYNHLKERLKPFFQQFAESGEAIGAEDIKAYFAKLRGDEQGIKEAAEGAKEGEGDGDSRKEQSGY
ncbi:Fc.00g103250.m01.CDS01 [Cosmosporella sp. VM-42]